MRIQQLLSTGESPKIRKVLLSQEETSLPSAQFLPRQWNNIFMDCLPWTAAKLSLRSQTAALESRAVGDSPGVLDNQNWKWIKHKLISHIWRIKQIFKSCIKCWNIFIYSSLIWATSTLVSSKTFLCSVSQHPNLPGLSIIQTIMKTCWPGERSGYNHKFLLQ